MMFIYIFQWQNQTFIARDYVREFRKIVITNGAMNSGYKQTNLMN